ncbi:MAG: response regulator transcription factor [Clostridia bacterium]|nr:response regulator transcription factor [Clostridia bacterium]
MRIAIVDDEISVRETLKGYIERMSKEIGQEMSVLSFSSGNALLHDFARQYDILIFDIDMPGLNGMDTARKIREMDDQVVILFITNIAQYAINGYEVDAVDYIIKPIGYYDFAMKFQKALRRAAQSRSQTLVIDTVNGPVSLEVESILYIEVMAHYLIYHTSDREYKVRASMKEQEGTLKQYHFVRCHKSYLINLAHLNGVTASEAQVSDLSIPLGRAYKESLLNEYMRYLHR